MVADRLIELNKKVQKSHAPDAMLWDGNTHIIMVAEN